MVGVGCKGKDAIKDRVVEFSCLLNCLKVSVSPSTLVCWGSLVFV